MLNWKTKIATTPFKWMQIQDVFGPEEYEQLIQSFPTNGFTLTEKKGDLAEKRYKTYNLTVMKHGQRTSGFTYLNDIWRNAILRLVDIEHGNPLEPLIGQSLVDTKPEVRFVVYSDGCWIDPHLDKDDKLLTQVLYFQHPSEEIDGGDFLVLNSKNIDDVVERIPPLPNSSVALIPSKRSWHAVSRVEATSNGPRRCVLIHFEKTDL